MTSLGEGVPENANGAPKTDPVRSTIVVEPVAEGVPFTEEAELIAVAVRSKIEGSTKDKLLIVDVAVPVGVGGNGELAVSVNAPVDRPSSGKLKEASDFVTL
jgi:hypothetical protein